MSAVQPPRNPRMATYQPLRPGVPGGGELGAPRQRETWRPGGEVAVISLRYTAEAREGARDDAPRDKHVGARRTGVVLTRVFCVQPPLDERHAGCTENLPPIKTCRPSSGGGADPADPPPPPQVHGPGAKDRTAWRSTAGRGGRGRRPGRCFRGRIGDGGGCGGGGGRRGSGPCGGSAAQGGGGEEHRQGEEAVEVGYGRGLRGRSVGRGGEVPRNVEPDTVLPRTPGEYYSRSIAGIAKTAVLKLLCWSGLCKIGKLSRTHLEPSGIRP